MTTRAARPLTILPFSNPLASAEFSSSGSSRINTNGTQRKLGHALLFIIVCGLTVHLIFFWREDEFRTYLSPAVSLLPEKNISHDLHTPTSFTPNWTFDSTASGSGIDLTEEAGHQASIKTKVEAGSTGRRPLTRLGFRADESYKLGSTIPQTYRHNLTSFIGASFPPSLQSELQAGFDLYFPLGDAGNTGPVTRHLPAMINYTNVWQTDKDRSIDFGGWHWHNKEWKWNMLNDTGATKWVRDNFGGSEIENLWSDLPTVILVSQITQYDGSDR
ncbi:membrane-bound alpha-1,6- mannosyltransferase Initiation-specific [Tulasnella sp. JGI-2019a]|nr:membrane-bound alpha-1,6- mannosyltransferase Initiation-specific [Tulasnella sp. JGI-2019a]